MGRNVTFGRQPNASLAAALSRSGASYRQLEYWARRGLFPDQPHQGPGSGYRREFTDRDIAVASALARLPERSVLTVATAGAARRAFEAGHEDVRVWLGVGVTLLIRRRDDQ